MSSIIGHINDLYDDYLFFCDLVNEKPVSGFSKKPFHVHEKELMEKHGYVFGSELRGRYEKIKEK